MDWEQQLRTVLFERVSEPNEQAFSLLIPRGWRLEGGIFRLNPMMQTGSAQADGAKLDLVVKQDAGGVVQIHWLPDLFYLATYPSAAEEVHRLPIKSDYQEPSGLSLPAPRFIAQVVFPRIRTQASSIQVVGLRPLPSLAEQYAQRLLSFPVEMTFSCDAALMTFLYKEGGMVFKERVITVVENWGALAAGMWGNKETLALRAPADEFDAWEPIFSVIQNSLTLDPAWLTGEVGLSIWGAGEAVGQQLIEQRQQTNAALHRGLFLTLLDQEEYINPYTQAVEIGSNRWLYRWENERQDVIYSNDFYYDPNADPALHASGFMRSALRPRGVASS